MNQDIPWQSAVDEFNDNVLPVLVKDGKQIGAAATSGDAYANAVFKYYAMLRRSFDPMTLILLQDAIRMYYAANANAEN